jgi:Fic-DOC domain mobile mystery protein B
MPLDSTGEPPAGAGNTPLDEDEAEGLIPPHITTRAELNQWEAQNIAQAQEWLASRAPDVLNEKVLRELHKRMFDETWEWAGHYRTSDKSISRHHWPEVPRLVRDLLANTRVRYESSMKTPEALDDIATSFHHELVSIHPWPNGNGRHSRLATDALLTRWGRPAFSWGAGTDPPAHEDIRERYIRALRDADNGDYRELRRFVRS